MLEPRPRAPRGEIISSCRRKQATPTGLTTASCKPSCLGRSPSLSETKERAPGPVPRPNACASSC